MIYFLILLYFSPKINEMNSFYSLINHDPAFVGEDVQFMVIQYQFFFHKKLLALFNEEILILFLY